MGFAIVSSNGNVAHNLMEYCADTEADIAKLPINGTIGSTCTVIDTAQVYVLNSLKRWVKLAGNCCTSGGSESSNGNALNKIDDLQNVENPKAGDMYQVGDTIYMYDGDTWYVLNGMIWNELEL